MTQFNEFTRFHVGMAYEVTAIKPYRRKSDGKMSKLVHWKATCHSCKKSRTHKTPADTRFFTGGIVPVLHQRRSDAANRSPHPDGQIYPQVSRIETRTKT